MVANGWSAAADNPTSKHQIARALVAQGHRVLWIEGAGMRRPSFGSGADRGRIRRKVAAAFRGAQSQPMPNATGALWILSPLLVPLPGLAWVRALNGLLFRAAARRWASRLGFQQPTLINYVPVLAGMMRGWREHGGVVVYHCVDRWDQFAMYDSTVMARMDAACRAQADLVVASSADLLAHCRRDHQRVYLVSHGVSYEHFAAPLRAATARPSDLPAGPVIGFFGLLSEWVDQTLLLQLAASQPQAQVVLIGMADVAVDALKNVANIHLLGPRPFAQLPDYVSHFDVGVIPFVVNELTRAVNPIKLREMLAAGCRVVATALPEVAATARDDGAVVVADNHQAFIDAVGTMLAHPPTAAARRALSERMASETWEAKTREIVQLIQETRKVAP
ncbi:MAG: glycosyltransferase [Verrucomicrobia bacterium]|nr:glycosyltransferase [Verrucomicrobiota bacterium]